MESLLGRVEPLIEAKGVQLHINTNNFEMGFPTSIYKLVLTKYSCMYCMEDISTGVQEEGTAGLILPTPT